MESLSSASLILLSGVLIIPCFLFVVSYRLFTHPLSNYQGPLVAKISDLYAAIYAARRRLHLQTWKDHQQYGDVIRQGPNKLVFNTATALHDIYLNDNVSKSRCYQAGNMNPTTTNVFNTTDKRLHRIKRQLIGQVITERAMRSFEPIMTEQVDVFIALLLASSQTNPPQALSMSQRCKYLGLDIVGHLAFGYDLKMQTNDTHRYLAHAIVLGSWRMNLYMQWPFIRRLRIETLFYLFAVLQGRSLLQTISKMIQARLSQERHAKSDLYSYMAEALDSPESDERITLSAIWNEAIFFFPAGGDTTGTVLSALFFYLAVNPICQRKVAEEVRSTFPSASEIRGGAQLTGCLYLRACINEAMRMSPAVGGTLWREQLPDDAHTPLVVDGHVIPLGTQVGVNIYSLHHNPAYFPTPFTYQPERWLHSDATSASTKAFVPFSLGARACAGKAMAYLEISLTMAKTIWHFDFKMADDQQRGKEFILQDIFNSTHDGPYLTFWPRSRNH